MNTPARPTPYDRLGGADALRTLVDRFYDLMDEDPDYYGIRKMHPADLSTSRDKLFWFLSGWTGGPPEYVDRFGHPFLRRRHLPFAIGTAERDQWMDCMRRAMRDMDLDAALRQELDTALFQTADFMRNQPQ
ncbi:MAG: hemoglobin-like protein [Thiobacillus sp. 65-29]|nr:MAG: hemoglobin-like protein [Thiobacillus sp. 65-29]